MRIWIINPFDELPGDTDVRHRYWSLAETFAEMGHEVVWWSSDFSHRRKVYREISEKSLSKSGSESGPARRQSTSETRFR